MHTLRGFAGAWVYSIRDFFAAYTLCLIKKPAAITAAGFLFYSGFFTANQ